MAIDLNDDIVQDFLVESREILERLGGQLVELEQRGGDADLLNSVFRGFHTIKGGAGFLGLDPLVEVCHRTEDVFNLLRNGDKQVSSELMDTVLRALDVVQAQFGDIESGSEPHHPPDDLLQSLDRLKAPDEAGGEAAASAPAEEPAGQQQGAGEPAPGAAEGAAGAGNEAPGDFSDAEFDELLNALDTEERERAEEAAASDEITDEEFEQLLDELHGKGQHTGRPMWRWRRSRCRRP
ncbi:Hpt domain-containing protein, partial [Halorhodospira neutriphila]|uniref:Hpt domain-containing protein n=1 Tax=Halorhodospira neutriphila TaxID=168379 RepID=UPI00190431AE